MAATSKPPDCGRSTRLLKGHPPPTLLGATHQPDCFLKVLSLSKKIVWIDLSDKEHAIFVGA
jgi:hypothetical protein